MQVNKLPFWAVPLAVLCLWLALVVPSLDKSRMQEIDELTHARVAQAAALDGAWWPLELDGGVFYEKPPLLLWLAGATAKLSGRPYDAWPYRLWTCLGAGVALACLALIGGLLERPWVGICAAAWLALQGDFIYHARFFTFDTPFVACFLAALAFSLRAVRGERGADWWWAGAALGLAAAFKSWFILTLVAPYACALFLHVPRPQRKRAFWALTVPPVGMLLLWILLYVRWDGWAFLTEEWSVNLLGRTAGTGWPMDPAGHAAHYLNWAALTSPAILPWALAAPLTLATCVDYGSRPETSRAKDRTWDFALTWTWVFSLCYLLGMATVKAETLNYAVPLEASLCLAVGLTLGMDLGTGRDLLRTCLLAASVLASLRLWAPFWSLGLGAALGLLWLVWGRQAQEGPSKRRLWTSALNLGLGLGLVALLGREAFGLLTRPRDANASIAELLLAHPAQGQGETLWVIPGGIQAPGFYSSYAVRFRDSLPLRRPAEACLVKTRGGWAFFPARVAGQGSSVSGAGQAP
jgi:4-amino-4-deoxy-L-arabinose transferase-like glycosyltransferase